MFPIICKIGVIPVYSYGLMLAIAVIVGSSFMAREAKSSGIKPDLIYDFLFWVMVFGVIGARVFFVVLNWDYYSQNLLEIIMVNKGGLAFQGGVVGGSVAAVIFIKFSKLNLISILDLSAPTLALGQAIGRIGCYLNGCCQGIASYSGLYSPVHDDYLIPVQLYSSLFLLSIFYCLMRHRKRSRSPGTTFALYFVLAPLERFITQFFRYDYEPLFFGLGLFQIISLIFIAVGVYAYTVFKSKSPR
ncbi:MAG: prolipoprotein diacylglyceryl transferase [Candidatus Omnitrophica bacterium]|nr:prolipoprotein diacylglyceryl transferase [Candidatus Omnitrophota bacterium]